jgi:protocatechuate 3,4-dioxygenase beta subunit
LVAAGLLFLLPFLTVAQVQAELPDPLPPPPGSATVRGRVTEEGSGRPLARFRVTASKSVVLNERSAYIALASTDASGTYEIKGLLPGKYVLTARPPEHVMTHLGQDVSDESPIEWRLDQKLRPVTAVKDANLEVNFTVRRASAIEGSVQTEDGDPLAHAWVVLERVDRFAQMEAVATDDRGFYRHYGLPRGRYRACVVPLDRAAATRPADRIGSCPRDADHGSVEVAIGTGEDRTADLAVRRSTILGTLLGEEVRASDVPAEKAIAGRVVDRETGAPLPRARVALFDFASKLEKPPIGIVATNEKGAFRIESPPPGPYLIRAEPPTYVTTHLAQLFGREAPLESGEALSFDKQMTRQPGSDDVVISLSRALTLEGRVVAENGDPLARIDVLLLRVGGPAGSVARRTDDRGYFRHFGLPPGRYRVCVRAVGEPGAASTIPVRRACFPEAAADSLNLMSGSVSGVDIVLGRQAESR